MKLTLKQLNDGYQPLQSVAAHEFPAKLAYRLGRIVNACNSEMELYRKTINDLIRKHGEGDDVQGYRVEQNSEAMAAFNREAEELLETEIEIWGDPIGINELEPHAKLKPSDLAWLDWLIVDGEAAEEKPKKTKLKAVKAERATA